MTVSIHIGPAHMKLATLPRRHFHCVVTSPPYFGLRAYLPDEHAEKHLEIGTERTTAEYLDRLLYVFGFVRDVLRDDGVCWVNLGDAYAAAGRSGGGRFAAERRAWREGANGGGRSAAAQLAKPKDMLGLPWEFALAMRDAGWYLRADVIWAKPNPTPSSVEDRPTSSHEHVFLFTKSADYFYDGEAVREPSGEARRRGSRKFDGSPRPRGNLGLAGPHHETRNLRDVWEVATEPFDGAHYAVMPREIAKRCIMAATSERGCCCACGAPWRRIVKRERLLDGMPVPADLPAACTTDRAAPSRAQGVGHNRITLRTQTLGFTPGCDCEGNVASTVVPCRVLDPFGGAGTTGLVAEELGHDSTLIELDERSVEIARARTSQPSLFASGQKGAPAP